MEKKAWKMFFDVSSIVSAIQFQNVGSFDNSAVNSDFNVQWDGRMFAEWKVLRLTETNIDILLVETPNGTAHAHYGDWIVKDESENHWVYNESLFNKYFKPFGENKSLDELEIASKSLVEYLQREYHPHVTAIVTSDSVELVEGLMRVPNLDKRD